MITYPAASDKQKNRGFAFLEFETHRQAALARQKLTREKATIWGAALCIDWAEPEPDVDDQTMSQVTSLSFIRSLITVSQVKILYVRNLLLSTEETAMRVAFERAAPPNTIEKVGCTLH